MKVFDVWIFRAWLVEQADRAALATDQYSLGWRAAFALAISKLDEKKAEGKR